MCLRKLNTEQFKDKITHEMIYEGGKKVRMLPNYFYRLLDKDS
ncbi:MAG: hypothetical protein ACM3SP_26550 [Chloroflexota bacterium]